LSGNIWIAVGVICIAISAFAIPWGFYLKSKESKKEIPRENATIQTPKKEAIKTKTLYDLFTTDFNKTHMLSDYHLTKNDKVVYSVKYIIWGDFDSKTMFFSIFLPKSDYTFKACRFLIPRYREILSGNIRSLMKGIINQAPGSRAESWDELSFSGRIYLYHETHLLPDRIDTLMEEYKKEGLSPQFRSREYLLMKNSPLYEQVIKKGAAP